MGYQVIESKKFKKKIDKLEKKYKRIFEVKNNISFKLWKAPKSELVGELVEDNYYLHRTDEPMNNDIVQIDILYQVNDIKEEVIIIDLKPVERVNNEE